MKKAITIILLYIMMLSLAACGGNSVDRALQGTWIAGGDEIYVTLTFKNGNVTAQTFMNGQVLSDMTKSGTYQIDEERIILDYDDGTKGNIDYTMEGDMLKLDGLERAR